MTIATIANGRPVKPDVDKLMEHYGGVPRDGRVITHREVEKIIEETHGSHRYSGVTSSWRKRMESEQGITLDGRSAAGEGFRVLSAPDMVEFSSIEHKSARRKVAKAVRTAALAPASVLSAATFAAVAAATAWLAAVKLASAGFCC